MRIYNPDKAPPYLSFCLHKKTRHPLPIFSTVYGFSFDQVLLHLNTSSFRSLHTFLYVFQLPILQVLFYCYQKLLVPNSRFKYLCNGNSISISVSFGVSHYNIIHSFILGIGFIGYEIGL